MEILNRKINFNYEILKSFEAGIELKGTEIKSIRQGSSDIRDAYVVFKDNEAYIINMYIAKYKEGNLFNHDETRSRKLLLHKAEIRKLIEAKQEKGISIIPSKVYFKGQYAKVTICICKGKKLYDKRESIKKRDIERSMRNSL